MTSHKLLYCSVSRLTEPDLSSRLNKRGGKLISKTLGKPSSPPTINAPPKVAVGSTKAKKDEVQRRKSSLHDMLRGSSRESDVAQAALLTVPGSGANQPSPAHGTHSNATSKPLNTTVVADERSSLRHGESILTSDARLENLEKLLAVAREEMTALRLELERVKQDAQASVEISGYQVAEAHLHTAPEKSIHHHQTHQRGSGSDLSDHGDDLASENDELRSHLTEVQKKLNAQTSFREPEPIHSEEDWNALALRLHETEKESQSRLQQLLSLKSSISTLTRSDPQVSDSELADLLYQLANKVREWVVSNYRRTKMNLDNLPETNAKMLRSIKSDYQRIDEADKFALYQAIVSRILMQVFKEPFCVGMPDHGIYIGLKTLCKDAWHHRTELHEWRRTTIRMIEKSKQVETIDGWRDQKLHALADECEAIMRLISSTGLTSSARSALVSIMMLAANFQRTLLLQKAEYSVDFFDALDKQDHCVDQLAMEPVNDVENFAEECNDSDAQRRFNFCVFPCLKKVQDNSETIVSRARVCCSVR